MRVAQLLYAGLGGHGSVAFSLLDADKNQEWIPLMGFLGIEPLLPAYAKSCKERDVKYEYFPSISRKPWHVWPKIFRWLTGCRPDAIVLHSVTALFPCLLYSWRRGVPLVVVEHQANALKRPIEWVFSYLAMLLADRVVLLTPIYQLELIKKLGYFYRPGKVQVIPNGIDTNRFKPVTRSVSEIGLVQLGMASRFTKIKRHDVLIEMFSELRRIKPEIDWRLTLAGGGESWEDVRQLIKNSGLQNYIKLPGQLDEVELIDWYQSLDVYLHASEGETLSTSLLQAMATSLPIIASDVPGIRSMLVNEHICGILIEKQNAKNFAEAVIEIYQNKQHALEMAQTGRLVAVSSYGQDEMFSNYRNILKSI